MNGTIKKLNGGEHFLGNIATMITVVASIVLGVVWIASSVNGVEAQVANLRYDNLLVFSDLDKRILVNEEALKHLPAEDRWRGQDQIIWSHKLEGANKDIGLKVPDPAEVIKNRLEND